MKFLWAAFLPLILCIGAAAQSPAAESLALDRRLPPVAAQPSLANNPASQNLPSQALTKGAWELGVLGGSGAGLSYARNTHCAHAGCACGMDSYE